MTGNQRIAHGLNGLLADATVFYQKLRHYHWNVAGSEFFTLHAKFEEMYTAWAMTIDQVAERILMVDGVPLHTLAAMLRETELDEDESIPAAVGMVDAILADLFLLRARAGTVIGAAETVDDRGTVNLLDDVCDAIEKDAWMLGAWKKEGAKAWQ
ncbi:MAG: DNA starvation/stationary phase protection protein [Gemmatimonadetes bacterium]|nr:DNA starvation/stationary phase protection protein [Gemmatimonadota bacterium]